MRLEQEPQMHLEQEPRMRWGRELQMLSELEPRMLTHRKAQVANPRSLWQEPVRSQSLNRNFRLRVMESQIVGQGSERH